MPEEKDPTPVAPPKPLPPGTYVADSTITLKVGPVTTQVMAPHEPVIIIVD